MTDKMTGKERASYRAKANSLEPLFQLGKGGMSEAIIAQTDDALRARELIKIKVLLESSPITPREAADQLAEATNAHVIQVIGGVIVLYRENPELRELEEKKKKEAKKKLATTKGAKDFAKKYKSAKNKGLAPKRK